MTASAADALGRLVAALDGAGIPRMLAGSFASSLHGEPRTTQDFDLLVDPSPEALRAFVQRIEADDWYVSEPAALDALRRRTSLTRIIHEAPRENGVQCRKDLRCTPSRGSFAGRYTVLDEIRGVGRKAGPAASALSSHARVPTQRTARGLGQARSFVNDPG